MTTSNYDDRLLGVYFRAFVLQSEGEIEEANRLLAQLEDVQPRSMLLGLRIERLRGRIALRRGDPAGRAVIRNTALALRERADGDLPLSNDWDMLLSDLCSDLSAIGDHDTAVAISRELLSDQLDPALHGIHATNLADRLRQRAVARQTAGLVEDATGDLLEAEAIAVKAFAERRALYTAYGSAHAAPVRAARTVLVSCTVMRRSLGLEAPDPVPDAQLVVRETLDAGDDSPLQVGTRIALLGSAHLTRVRANNDSAGRAAAYLRYGWDETRSGYARAWIALDLVSALEAAGDKPAATRIRREALGRLEPQCGVDYPPCIVLRQSG